MAIAVDVFSRWMMGCVLAAHPRSELFAGSVTDGHLGPRAPPA